MNTQQRKVRLVESSIERVARMLSQQFGIRVVWSKNNADTNGNVIRIPALPADAPDELLEAVQGYIDHETGHILFTDFDAIGRMPERPDAKQFMCINAVEDVRIEQRVGVAFPGAPYNLRKSHEWVYKKIAEKWERVPRFERVVVAYFMYSKYADNSDFWSAVDAATRARVQACVEAVGDLSTLRSTDDAIQAGLKLYGLIQDLLDQEPQEAQEETPDTTQAGEGSAESEAENDQSSEEAAPEEATGGELSSSENAHVSMDNLAELISEEADKVHDQVTRATSSGAKGPYVIYSTEFDEHEFIADPKDVKSRQRKLHRLRTDTQPVVSTMKTKLVHSLRTSSQQRWLGGKEEGRIDSRRLYKAALGLGNDVFKVRTDKIALDTVVSIAIDHSGSMAWDNKWRLANEATIVLGDVLQALRVPFNVYGYTTGGRYFEEPIHMRPNPFARWGTLWLGSYHEFGDNWDHSALRLLADRRPPNANNTYDGESVKYGIQRLLLRPERRKLLFVMCDGVPNPGYGYIRKGEQYLRDVVSAAPAYGVEVVAFGIQSEQVKNFYPNHVLIHNLDNMTREPLRMLDAMLRKNMRTR